MKNHFDPKTTPILIIGSTGQVGRSLTQILGTACIPLSRRELDLAKIVEIENCLQSYQPAVVINAGAYTDVERAEEEGQLAMVINGHAPGVISRWCARHNIPYIHYSSDYVYPGTGENYWNEDDALSPLNVYGRTKAEGDYQVIGSGSKYLIFRAPWIYDTTGRNFLTKILGLAKIREELQVVCDQIGSPTCACDVAYATVEALQKAMQMTDFPSGIYHVCNTGLTSWYGFAKEIISRSRQKGIRLAVQSIKPVTTKDFPTKAVRPHNSRLCTRKLQQVFDISLLDWRDALQKCIS